MVKWSKFAPTTYQLSVEVKLFSGELALNNNLSVWIAVLSAAVVGLIAMFLVAYMIFKFAQLEQSGTLNLYNALDKAGEVYLTIPAEQKGVGKIHLLVEGRIREMDAVTSGGILKTGTAIKVIDILDGNILKVVPMNEQEVIMPANKVIRTEN